MLTFSIRVTAAGLDAIKAELRQALPGVKSSHRCEAIARGLGFRTYASLLDSNRSPIATEAKVEGTKFVAYLAERGFSASASPFYRAVVRTAIRAVMEKMPRLTLGGIGVGEPRRKADGSWETVRDFQAKFVAWREELLDDQTVEQFLLSLAFLAHVKSTKTIRDRTSSYWIKHIAENYTCTYPDGSPLGPQYVANGALIAAAAHAGFQIKTHEGYRGYPSLNVTFNMSWPSLRDFDSEIRPNGAQAQQRRFREERLENKKLFSDKL